jgi:hypothetical protein
MPAEAAEQTRPIKSIGTRQQQMGDVRPIETIALLDETFARYQVTACVHGHAHTGSIEGRTTGGVPVYNVSLPLMRKQFPDRPPFRILELTVTDKEAEAPGREAVASNLHAADVTRPIDTIPA